MSESHRDVLDAKYKSFYIDLFDVINSKLICFSSQQQYRIVSFALYCHTRNKLLTDDSYLFLQEIKKLKTIAEHPTTYSETIINTTNNEFTNNNNNNNTTVIDINTVKTINISTSTSSYNNGPNYDEILERQKVLILTLETCCRNYRWSWAKPPIESVIQS
jgi:hypothetical protein